VNVSTGDTPGIDFSLAQGAAVSGVVKNTEGEPQANMLVNCWTDGGYGNGGWTDETGFYRFTNLPVGFIYLGFPI
jgi:hypothetical protein